jgi:serine/threonine protein kinase
MAVQVLCMMTVLVACVQHFPAVHNAHATVGSSVAVAASSAFVLAHLSCAAYSSAAGCTQSCALQSERFGKHFASFGREAALLADLNHPNVLRFFGVVTESAQDNTVIGIMTEYIRGGSMSSFLR